MKPLADIDSQIVCLLKEGSFVSGQEISTALKLSRSAVWKRINGLRKGGYAIEARPNKGYKLSTSEKPYTTVAVSSALKTETFARVLHFHESVESTNTLARKLAQDDAEEGTAVIAQAQTNGRGRRGRAWHSPKGVNLYTSIILRPDISPVHAPTLTLLAAVALAEAIEEFIAPIRVNVKWPNDILINGRKVAGILTEMSSEPDKIDHIIIGIGVNLNIEAKALPEELAEIATSLREASGRAVDMTLFACSLYSSLEKWYALSLSSGFAPVLAKWRTYFDKVGQNVKVSEGGKGVATEGICTGIDDDGALLIKTTDNVIERVVSGDVI
ncbi:MAG: biotin--[acetyl-CoA-carboxylase] ligase [Deltaproteobacteria bacterium]|nr:biotin--[acetyl-CoA-carboxylase] ligase [Deltaproteobacteria bacterium]